MIFLVLAFMIWVIYKLRYGSWGKAIQDWEKSDGSSTSASFYTPPYCPHCGKSLK